MKPLARLGIVMAYAALTAGCAATRAASSNVAALPWSSSRSSRMPSSPIGSTRSPGPFQTPESVNLGLGYTVT
jgi:hypothetical protein